MPFDSRSRFYPRPPHCKAAEIRAAAIEIMDGLVERAAVHLFSSGGLPYTDGNAGFV